MTITQELQMMQEIREANREYDRMYLQTIANDVISLVGPDATVTDYMGRKCYNDTGCPVDKGRRN